MSSPAPKPKSESELRMIEIKGLPAERVSAASSALVDAAIAFCMTTPMPPPRRAELLQQMARVLHDLEGVADGPIYNVRMAADRLVVAAQTGAPQLYLEYSLRDRVADMFSDRGVASFARWQRSAGLA